MKGKNEGKYHVDRKSLTEKIHLTTGWTAYTKKVSACKILRGSLNVFTKDYFR